jgi:hypothetical protein
LATDRPKLHGTREIQLVDTAHQQQKKMAAQIMNIQTYANEGSDKIGRWRLLRKIAERSKW